MIEFIDFAAARAEREKLTIAVAGLVAANCDYPTAADVARFAEEVRAWPTRVDDYYQDVTDHVPHDAARAWATELFSAIPGWRAALFGEALR